MKHSPKRLIHSSLFIAAIGFGVCAFAQSNVTTDSSVTTDTTTDAGMKGADSVRPADSTRSETIVQKHATKRIHKRKSRASHAKTGRDDADEPTRSAPAAATDDSKK